MDGDKKVVNNIEGFKGLAGSVIPTVPGQLIDTRPLIDQAKMLLDSVSSVAISCD
jgi:hypothetical protein